MVLHLGSEITITEMHTSLQWNKISTLFRSLSFVENKNQYEGLSFVLVFDSMQFYFYFTFICVQLTVIDIVTENLVVGVDLVS